MRDQSDTPETDAFFAGDFEYADMLGFVGHLERERDVARAALAELRKDKARLSQGALDVLAERQRHVEVEGWTSAHDAAYTNGELAKAAACYALAATMRGEERRLVTSPDAVRRSEGLYELWPFAPGWWKPKTRRRDLVRAASMLLAEIDRMDAMWEGGAG